MYRESYSQRNTINFVINISSIGDSICALIPLLYAIKNHNQHDLKIWIGEDKNDLFLPFIDKKYINYTYDHFKEVNRSFPTRVASLEAPINNCNGSLIDFFTWSLLNKNLQLEDKIYPKYPVDDIDVSKYDVDFSKAVLLSTNYIWLTKTIKGKVWNEVVEYILGKGLIPVFIGKNMKMEHLREGNFYTVESSKTIDFTKGIDLINKTSLRDLVKIISMSKGIIGPDSGTLHVAGMTDIPIIGSYTVKSDYDLMPIRRNKEGKAELGYNCYPVIPDVECKFCVTNKIFDFGWDFRYCYYDDYKCISSITSDTIIEKLEEALNDNAK